MSIVRSAPPRKLTLVEQIDGYIDALTELRRIAANDRRKPHQHDDLVDEVNGLGRVMTHFGRRA